MDLEEIYDTRINPLMSQIIGICKANGLPLHATFSFKNGKYCTTHIPDDSDPTMKGLRYAAISNAPHKS